MGCSCKNFFSAKTWDPNFLSVATAPHSILLHLFPLVPFHKICCMLLLDKGLGRKWGLGGLSFSLIYHAFSIYSVLGFFYVLNKSVINSFILTSDLGGNVMIIPYCRLEAGRERGSKVHSTWFRLCIPGLYSVLLLTYMPDPTRGMATFSSLWTQFEHAPSVTTAPQFQHTLSKIWQFTPHTAGGIWPWTQMELCRALLLPANLPLSRLNAAHIPSISAFALGCHITSPYFGNTPSASQGLCALILSLLIAMGYLSTWYSSRAEDKAQAFPFSISFSSLRAQLIDSMQGRNLKIKPFKSRQSFWLHATRRLQICCNTDSPNSW